MVAFWSKPEDVVTEARVLVNMCSWAESDLHQADSVRSSIRWASTPLAWTTTTMMMALGKVRDVVVVSPTSRAPRRLARAFVLRVVVTAAVDG